MDVKMRKTVCVYVGGCVGASAIHYAESFDEIHIFEPNPEAYAQLVENLKLYQEKVFIQNYACDVSEGFRHFYVTKNVVSSSLGEPTEITNGIEVEKIITVRTINLLSYLKQKKINLIDLIVTDTQGSDLTILSTIKEIIDDSRVLQILTETHSDVISIYKDMNNRFSGFKNLLEKNYYLDFYLFDMKLKNNTYVISELDEEWDTVWTVKAGSEDFKIKLIPLEDEETGVLINLARAKKRNPNFNLSEYIDYRRGVKNVDKNLKAVSSVELLNLTKFHLTQKQYFEAKKLLTILTDRRPLDFEIRFQLACLLQIQSNEDSFKAITESKNELFKILSDFPDIIHKPKEYSEFFIKLAESLYETEQFKDARLAYGFISRHLNRPEHIFRYAELLAIENLLDLRITQLLLEAIEIDPGKDKVKKELIKLVVENRGKLTPDKIKEIATHGFRISYNLLSGSNIYWDQFIPKKNPRKILEIGSFEGQSICYFIEKLADGNPLEIHSVDIWETEINFLPSGMVLSAAEKNFDFNLKLAAKNKPNIKIFKHKGFSDVLMSKMFTSGLNNYFDLVYLNVSHNDEIVLSDAVLAFKLVKVGGVIGFNKYLEKHPEEIVGQRLEIPKMAIDAFTSIYFRKIETRPVFNSQLWLTKISD